MVINVAQQLEEPVGSVRYYSLSEAVVTQGEPGCRIYGGLKLLRTDGGILVSGTLEATVEAVCSRCLTSFDQPLTL